MISEELEFPMYRKLFNGKSYYKVESLLRMTEMQLIGGQVSSFDIVANQYPEQLLIKDVINLDSAVYLSIPETEYESIAHKKRET
jgi:hypothetical protein